MKIYKFLILSIAAFTLAACFSDDTSDAENILTEIVIEEGSINSVYNIDKHETLQISPVITQKNGEKPLSYTWEIDSKVYSHDEQLVFVGREHGKFTCRLIVENADGKAFFPFILYVNTPYEEGITIISKDALGNSMLSFMQKPKSEGDVAKFTDSDCFSLNNPDELFASNVSDIVQSNGSLIISCQGGGEDSAIPTIYYLNEKTFVLENMFTVPEYDDFVPTIMAIPSKGYSGSAYPVLCENGKIYEFSTTESALTKPRKFQSTYAQSCIVNNGGYSTDILFWDNERSALAQLYNSYGPYYCSTEYHLLATDADFQKKNYFANRKFVCMAKVNMTQQELVKADNRQEFLIITSMSNSAFYRSEVLHTDFWGYDYETFKPTFAVQNSSTAFIMNIPIDETTPCVANKTYFSLLFADGNKVRRWYYNKPLSTLATAPELLTVGSGNAVITDFVISDDNTKVYVAFYEPDVQGLNGCMWVFDSDSGEVLEEYNNICYEPVKMIYKYK